VMAAAKLPHPKNTSRKVPTNSPSHHLRCTTGSTQVKEYTG